MKSVLLNWFKYSNEEANELVNVFNKSIEDDTDMAMHIVIGVSRRNYLIYQEQDEIRIYSSLTEMIDIITTGEYISY